MEKILFVTNNHLLNTVSIDFACHLAQLTQSALTGVFVEDEVVELVPPVADRHSYFEQAGSKSSATDVVMDAEQVMRYFDQECRAKGVRSDLHPRSGNPVKDAVAESRFADLLIVGPEMLTQPYFRQVPSPFVKRLLANAECPVVIAPNVFTDIDEIIFCYDGSASSVFAMKQFTYLLRAYEDKKVIILEVNGDKSSLIEKDKIRAWVSCYYSQIGYEVLQGDPEEELFKHLFLKQNTFVVMGAYGRSLLSNFFRRSAADTVLKAVDLPVFISHH